MQCSEAVSISLFYDRVLTLCQLHDNRLKTQGGWIDGKKKNFTAQKLYALLEIKQNKHETAIT